MGDYKLPPPPEGLIWKYTPGRYMDKISLVKQGLFWDKEKAYFYIMLSATPESVLRSAETAKKEAVFGAGWQRVCYEANMEALKNG